MKRIIIIGASSGIGQSLATQYILSGKWQVGIAARRSGPLEALRNLAPDRVYTATIDVTADDAAMRLSQLIATMGGMDVFLLSSGTGKQNPSLIPDIERLTIDTNVKGFTMMIDAAYNYFKSTGTSGQIAAITSIAGTRGIGIAASYSATKRYQWCYLTAIEQLAHTQHVDVAITDLRPGFVSTPMLDDGNYYPFRLSADYTARAIRRAIAHRRRVAIINRPYAILVFFWRLIPRCAWKRLTLKTDKNKS